MCANEIKTKTYDVSKDHASHIEDSKKMEKSKDEKKSENKFPLIDPFYITWFWPVY